MTADDILVAADQCEARGVMSAAVHLRAAARDMQGIEPTSGHSWATPLGLVIANALKRSAARDWFSYIGPNARRRFALTVERSAPVLRIGLGQFGGWVHNGAHERPARQFRHAIVAFNAADLREPSALDAPMWTTYDEAHTWIQEAVRRIADGLGVRVHAQESVARNCVELLLEVGDEGCPT